MIGKLFLVVAIAIMAMAVPASADITYVGLDTFSYDAGLLTTTGSYLLGGNWEQTSDYTEVLADGTVKLGAASVDTGNLEARWAYGSLINTGYAMDGPAGYGNYFVSAFQAKKGEDNGSTSSYINYYKGNGTNHGQWMLSGNNIQAKDGINVNTALTDEWKTFAIVFKSQDVGRWYYVDGVLLGYTTATTNMNLDKVQLENYVRADGTFCYIDNFGYGYGSPVVPEPSSLLAFSAFGVGMLGYIRRRRA